MDVKSELLLFAAAAVPLFASADAINPPEYIGPIDAYHAKATRRFACAPSVAVARNGRLWATWFSGKSPCENRNNFALLATSDDGGETWTEVQCVEPDREGQRRGFDPQVWVDPDGILHWFWTDVDFHVSSTLGVWEGIVGDACRPFERLSKPRVVGCGIMLGDPLVLSDGDWLLPISGPGRRQTAGFVASSDRGKTWHWRGGATCTNVEDVCSHEHCVVEKKDGTLWTVVRRRIDIGQAFSTDKGRTWTPVEAFDVKCTNTRVWLAKLRSGNCILVKNGPIGQNVGRKLLTAYLSRDEGKTWEGGLLIDERDSATYPNGCQAEDGLIYVVNDHDRKKGMDILLSQFTEEDVLAGKNVSGRMKLLHNINRR